MLVTIAPLILSLLVKSTQATCPKGFICKVEKDTFELLCNPAVARLKLQTVGGLLADVPTQTKRVKVKCFNLRVPVKLTFANLSHVRELTLESVNVSASESNFFHGISNITHLVLRELSFKRIEKGYFEGLTDVRSLTIEHLDDLEYLHPDVLKPFSSLQSIAFRYIGSACNYLHYADYSKMLGGIQSFDLHTLVLYAIHTSKHAETHLNIDNLFSRGTVGTSLKYLDLGHNNVEFFLGYPIKTLPSLEYLSLAENVILGSQFLTVFWIQLIGHMTLKTLDVSGMNGRAAATSGDHLFRLTVDNDCSGAIRMTIGPQLQSISLNNSTLLANSFIKSAPFCFFDIHRVLKYVDIAHARCTTPITCSIDQVRALEYFNMQNVNTANLSTDIFSKMPNLKVLLMGRNDVGNIIENDARNSLFRNNSKLQVLDLAECQLTDIPPKELSNLRQLQHLNLSGNSLRLVNLQNLTEIRILNLSRNRLTTLAQDARALLDKMAAKRQVDLDLSRNPLQCVCNNTDFVTWAHVSKVKFLNMDDTRCFDENNTEHLLFLFDGKLLDPTCHTGSDSLNSHADSPWRYLRVVLPVGLIVIVALTVACFGYMFRRKWHHTWNPTQLLKTTSDVQLN